MLAREPSEVQLHFNRDTWKTLAEAERALAQAEGAAKQPASSAQTASEVRLYSALILDRHVNSLFALR